MSIQEQTYNDILLSIKRGTYQGNYINAKPLLLLTVIRAVENLVIKDNRIYLTNELIQLYKNTSESYGNQVTPIFKPFYYLSYDEFWHLKWKTDSYVEKRPSTKFLRDNIEYAYLDNVLWDLLQNDDVRNSFRNSIENNYLLNKQKPNGK